ncbi:NAD-dependent epimerase/dehydratase family protein [Nitrospirillum sp. BR 11163]|uniref:NAD-dependent epimerase/dehydratase family protein n=1 Tax=Nitrospirillum sp. BR 11163 TaxID=3104323 RepID=UPI002B0036BB|nr:NAD-dependent epimerase/dehydratase family protein [Nitrospirillum sp. BR 11163]MEA1675870.1 NAD(P)H-binding protein [Nitrospirillum sp. BR 11163]
MARTNGKTVLVIGAKGGVGGAVAARLLADGWTVKALARGQGAGDRGARPDLAAAQWIQGDAMNTADVAKAAAGVDVIVHAVNPPGYKDWDKLVLPMLDNTIAAAKAVGARIVLPGTVYNYGPDALPNLTEESPQNPVTVKGGIRVAMERRLRQASTEGGRVLILRCGDFFGPRAGNNWFGQGLVKPGRTVTSIPYPGPHPVGHAWAYLPDVAETVARLLARENDLATFETFHFGGHWLEPGVEMARAIQRVVEARGGARPALKSFPWWLVTLASPFVTVFREMREMRYLWQRPVRLENAKLKAFLGAEPHTPLDTAVATALADLGCVPA